MYNHANQYRCTIIRGKSQSEMDNILPMYARVIDSICPCKFEDFTLLFNNAFGAALSTVPSKKTLDNHRTEIANKLFGMYYEDTGMVYPSERTLKFLSDSDTPAFFKDICYKMQFPNGSQSLQTVKERVRDSIKIRQFPFLLKVMLLARSSNITLTKKEIGYYILNALDVLQGKSNPLEVYDAIVADRKHGIERNIQTPGKELSYDWQHIHEQVNLLELANLVIIDSNDVTVNSREMATIELFAEKYNETPAFDVYSYDLEKAAVRKEFYSDWDYYFSRLSEPATDSKNNFDTSAESLGVVIDTDYEDDTSGTNDANKFEIGDEGERYVFEYEKRRVAEFNFRLVNKVIHLGKTRGLGYDIQSVVAKGGDNSDFVKYIEVKSTKRVTAPDISSPNWIDTINMTRNEWVASQQHRDSYSIFRVYFVRDSVIMFLLTDIAQKHKDNLIQAVPTTYRLDFKNNAVDEVINQEIGVTANA